MPLLPLLLAQAVALPPRPHLVAVPVKEPPVLDGKLDDAAWSATPGVSSFTKKYPEEGKAAAQRTTVRVVYDENNIYVGVDCEQPNSPVVARLTRRDHWTEADYVTIDIDSKRSGTTAYEFQVNAAGVLTDTLRFNDTDQTTDWDEVWDAKTEVREHGWSVEFRIPLRILRFDPLHDQSWGFQAYRYISALQELDQWAYVPKAVAGVVSHYGKLDHLVDLHPTNSPLELIPFVAGRIRYRDPTTSQLASGFDTWASAGGDIKWHPTQELTVQATINPDFAQVEADQDYLNLTKFESYFPEKRPFFLEGYDAFQTPYQLLYTKRIGRAAPAPAIASTEQLVDVPSPATIYSATKITGKIADKWSIGTLQALTAQNNVQVQREDGTRQSRLVDPLSLFNVLRVKREISSNGHIGLMLTSLTHAEPASSYPLYAATPVSPREILCPTGTYGTYGTRCFNDAYVGAIDGRWRSSGGDYSITAQAAGSLLHNGPVRQVMDGTNIASGDTGGGAQINLSKDGGDHWVGNLSADYETPKFTYDDVGFMQRANTMGVGGAVEYRTLNRIWETTETHTRLQAWEQENTYGLTLQRGAMVRFQTTLRNFWWGAAAVGYFPRVFDDREVGNGVALERAGGPGTGFGIGSDPTQPITTTFWFNGQALTDGVNVSTGADFVFHLHPQLDLDISPSATLNKGEPRSIGQFTPSGKPIFGKLDAPSLSTTLRATYTFIPRLTLQAYAQLYLASLHYSDFSYANPSGAHPVVHLADLQYEPMTLGSNPDSLQSALNINIVLRWEYMLGSAAYLVYSRSQVPNVTLNPGDVASMNISSVTHGAASSDAVVLKVSYWWG